MCGSSSVNYNSLARGLPHHTIIPLPSESTQVRDSYAFPSALVLDGKIVSRNTGKETERNRPDKGRSGIFSYKKPFTTPHTALLENPSI